MRAMDTGLLWILCATRLPPLGPTGLSQGGCLPRLFPPVADRHRHHRQASVILWAEWRAVSRCRALLGQRQASAPSCGKPETQVLPTQRCAVPPCSEGVQCRPGSAQGEALRTRAWVQRKAVLAMESCTGRAMSWVSPVVCGLSAPLLPRGGALPGAAQPPSPTPPT